MSTTRPPRDAAAYPSTAQSAAAPPVEPSFEGVRISAPSTVRLPGPIIVTGTFQLPEREAERIDPHLHRALVLVAMNGAVPYAVHNPFEGVLLFDDDEERGAWGRRGHFTVALPRDGAIPYEGEYHVFVSLGEFLSNTVTVAVT